jgi:acetyl-CoA C-acetyltransferase
MTPDPSRIPVLVGIGQSIEREATVDVIDLASRAAEAAFEDAPGLIDRIQRLTMVAISFSRVSKNPATELAKRLGLDHAHPVQCEVTTPGGNTPQWLVNRASEEIANGELETTLICGAEATHSMKLANPDSDFLTAARSNMEEGDGEADPIVGASVRGMLGQAEIQAKLVRPSDTYPIFESALAARNGASLHEWRTTIGAFLSRSSQVAAKNPFAWFPEALSPEDISTPSVNNRLTAEPYTKRMNSFASVDMGSALIVTTLAIAREAGLADQCVFPLAGASNTDLAPAARPELDRSPAIRAAAKALFKAAKLGLDDIDFVDLYSCFPVAVEVGAAEIGLAIDDARGLTLTGSMSFFGGPGNNYTSHGIASAGLRLRESGRFAYVSGNGGLLSKHALGLYGNQPGGGGFVLADTSKEQSAINASGAPVATEANGNATVEGGTVIYDRRGDVAAAPVIARCPDGSRLVAIASPDLLPELAGRSLVGETIVVSGSEPPSYTLEAG